MFAYKKVDERAIEPTRAHGFDAGLDLYALEDTVIRPGQIVKVSTGIHVALEQQQVGLYWGKSGRASNGLSILGGCIDGPYRGLLSVVATNINTGPVLDYFHALHTETNKVFLQNALDRAAAASITIPYGKAITQFLVLNGLSFPIPTLLESNEFDRLYGGTERGEKGFGSSDQERERAGFGPCALYHCPDGRVITNPEPIFLQFLIHNNVKYERSGDTNHYYPVTVVDPNVPSSGPFIAELRMKDGPEQGFKILEIPTDSFVTRQCVYKRVGAVKTGVFDYEYRYSHRVDEETKVTLHGSDEPFVFFPAVPGEHITVKGKRFKRRNPHGLDYDYAKEGLAEVLKKVAR